MSNLYKKTIISIFLLVISFQLAYAESWRLDKDEGGIKIYTRSIQGSAIREIRGEVTINSSLDSLMAVFDDIQGFPEWNHKSSKAALLKRVNQREQYHYQNIKMPFPVADRDLILRSQIIQSNNSVIVRSTAVANYCKKSLLKSCQMINKSKNINVIKSTGRHEFIPQKNGDVSVIWHQHVEPAGKLPKWLVNSLLIDVPYNTLNKLRKQVKKKKYKQAQLKRDSTGKILGF